MIEAFKGQLNSFLEKGPAKSEGPMGPGGSNGNGLALGKTKNGRGAHPANRPYKFAKRGPSPEQLLRHSGNRTRTLTRGPVNANSLKMNVRSANVTATSSDSGRVSFKFNLSQQQLANGGQNAIFTDRPTFSIAG